MNQKFENVEFYLPEEERNVLCIKFLEKILSPASLSVLNDTLKETKDFEKAVFSSVLNQAIIDVLEQEIQKMEKEQK